MVIDMYKLARGEKEVVKVSLETMGHEVGSKHLMLWDTFLRKYLNAGQLDATMPDFIKSYQVMCPYCTDGILELVSVAPDYSGGMSPVPMVKHHTANRYAFKCVCGALFFGKVQWMWID